MQTSRLYLKGHRILLIIGGWFSSFILLTFLLSFVIPNPLNLTLPLFSYAGIFGIAALSLNLEVGVTGISNFGKIAFFMVGCYTTGLMYLFKFPIFIAIPIGMVVAGFFGYLLALPTLDLREDYLAITTIAVGEIVRTVLRAETWIAWPQNRSEAGGTLGLTVENIFRSNITSDLVLGNIVLPSTLIADFLFLFSITAVFLLVYLFVEIIYNSPFGRVLKSIRDNDLAAESLGVDIVEYRIKAFVVSSALAGLAGGIWALYIVGFSPDGFPPYYTFFLWIIVIIGGIGNNRGVIFGSLLVWSIEYISRTLTGDIDTLVSRIVGILNPLSDFYQQISSHIPIIGDFLLSLNPISFFQEIVVINPPEYYPQFFFGILLILFLIYRPKGIFPERPIQTVAELAVSEHVNKTDSVIEEADGNDDRVGR